MEVNDGLTMEVNDIVKDDELIESVDDSVSRTAEVFADVEKDEVEVKGLRDDSVTGSSVVVIVVFEVKTKVDDEVTSSKDDSVAGSSEEVVDDFTEVKDDRVSNSSVSVVVLNVVVQDDNVVLNGSKEEILSPSLDVVTDNDVVNGDDVSIGSDQDPVSGRFVAIVIDIGEVLIRSVADTVSGWFFDAVVYEGGDE